MCFADQPSYVPAVLSAYADGSIGMKHETRTKRGIPAHAHAEGDDLRITLLLCERFDRAGSFKKRSETLHTVREMDFMSIPKNNYVVQVIAETLKEIRIGHS
jgi:hypothetical protein